MLKLICTLMLCVPLAIAADVSGSRQLTVETNQGTGSPTVVFQQHGEQLTGTFKARSLVKQRSPGR